MANPREYNGLIEFDSSVTNRSYFIRAEHVSFFFGDNLATPICLTSGKEVDVMNGAEDVRRIVEIALKKP
jgi:hypothetical protein